MTDVVVMWLMIVLALSLLCNLGYLCRDMARERRRERRQVQRKEKKLSASHRGGIR